MLLVGEFNEVKVLTLLDVVVVDDDDWSASEDFRTKLSVVLYLDFDHRVGFCHC